ncbi:MAG TPA: hypothetical protein VL528_09555 [Oxalicibacterium sp.]|nr:hypothetical protein [Oxalicibacterium sp.]
MLDSLGAGQACAGMTSSFYLIFIASFFLVIPAQAGIQGNILYCVQRHKFFGRCLQRA